MLETCRPCERLTGDDRSHPVERGEEGDHLHGLTRMGELEEVCGAERQGESCPNADDDPCTEEGPFGDDEDLQRVSCGELIDSERSRRCRGGHVAEELRRRNSWELSLTWTKTPMITTTEPTSCGNFRPNLSPK